MLEKLRDGLTVRAAPVNDLEALAKTAIALALPTFRESLEKLGEGQSLVSIYHVMLWQMSFEIEP